MVRMDLQFKGPSMPRAQDAFRSEEEHWFATDKEKKFYRVVRSQPPALLTFSYVDRPELVDDFLKPPRGGAKGVTPGSAIAIDPGQSRRLRLGARRTGRQVGRASGQRSDGHARRRRPSFRPTAPEWLDRDYLGEDPIPIAVFKIQSGKGEPVTHMALANLPMVPNVMPPADPTIAKAPRTPLAAINYMITPTLDPKINGRFGQIEVLAGPGRGALLPRFRPGKRERQGRASRCRAAGKEQADRRIRRQRQHADDDHVPGRRVLAFGRREVDLRAGRAAQGPDGQRDRGLPGRDDRDGQTKEVWLSRSETTSTRRAAYSSRSVMRCTRSCSTSIAGRWASS